MPIGGGAGWERLEDAPRDLAAWIDVATGLSPGGVVLAGHSSGAQRVVLYQAERQDPRIRGIALASPDLHGFQPPGELEAAERLVAEGRGLEVVPAQPYVPFYRQSGASVASRAAVLARLQASGSATIACPVLAVVGEREPGSTNLLEMVRQQLCGAARVETQVIPGADHAYTGCEGQVAHELARWAATLG
jgi:pimeloyl-ACP methyl ester carboxylesterase